MSTRLMGDIDGSIQNQNPRIRFSRCRPFYGCFRVACGPSAWLLLLLLLLLSVAVMIRLGHCLKYSMEIGEYSVIYMSFVVVDQLFNI